MRKIFLVVAMLGLAFSLAYSQGVSREVSEDPYVLEKQEIRKFLVHFQTRFNVRDYRAMVGEVDIEYDVVRADVDPSRSGVVPLNEQGRAYIQDLIVKTAAVSDSISKGAADSVRFHLGLDGVDLQTARDIAVPTGINLAPDHVMGIRAPVSPRKRVREVTTAQSEYSMQARRLMTFQFQQMMKGLHPAARLVLHPGHIDVQGARATVDVNYEIRSPLTRDRFAGQMILQLVHVKDEWRVQRIKSLVDRLWTRS